MQELPDIIMSASGWRKVFAESGKEDDGLPCIGKKNTIIAMLAAEIFADYIIKISNKASPSVVCGTDTRPTGSAVIDAVLKIFLAKGIVPHYAGVIAAPEIMAYSTRFDGFMYVSASHNPIGHNGLKFGLKDGGVLAGEENLKLANEFLKKWHEKNTEDRLKATANTALPSELDWVYANAPSVKNKSAAYYHDFMMRVISDSDDPAVQKNVFSIMRSKALKKKIAVVCDMNGSSRSLSVDEEFFKECGMDFYKINAAPGQIVHGIIPEGENLLFCAAEMERLKDKEKLPLLGYMPDCDGDRGNIVYWDRRSASAKTLEAQEVFALAVLSELAYGAWKNKGKKDYKPAVVVNCATSMRIDRIAEVFGAEIFRAEVGEANAVNLARKKRLEGYTVRIFGEGTNGGNITHPEAVRDPLNTVFALVRLLVMHPGNSKQPDLFKMWCKLTGQEDLYSPGDITITDIINTLPKYKTTNTFDKRAIMHIKTKDHGILKKRFQKEFEKSWVTMSPILKKKYGIVSYTAAATNGTVETQNIKDFSVSGNGGLKILFYGKENDAAENGGIAGIESGTLRMLQGRNKNGNALAFMWMRGSGTESVFRVLCDVKCKTHAKSQSEDLNSDTSDMEEDLLNWERSLIEIADKYK
ncbi:phosphoglucomutase [Treponema parvum]|uniref:Phosphoglucomutase n=1 Tax=Treponema parvum TaxID=138851 RepID=A0A975F479_9SPIR|nr:phosphoglucomutase [Treponema parvum]QTQ13719.1 phosphoglucomutase [Treponema parvum]